MAKALSVYLPRWPVQLAKREHQRATVGRVAREERPTSESASVVVLLASEKGKQWVACVCERAEDLGVSVGMSMAHAKALLKGTPVLERPFVPDENAERLRRLARWALRFSPVVATDEPDGLLLDLAGCEHLFGGDECMVATIDESFSRLGLRTRLALAPSVGCAWAMARFADDRVIVVSPARVRDVLAPLPIAALRLDSTFVHALNEVGIERIDSLLDLPRQELACRFGADVLRRLDQATGDVRETITPLRVSTPVEATRLFDGAVTSLEAVAITVRELLFALVLQLESRGCGARTLDVVLHRMSSEPSRASIALSYPSRDARHLWTLLRPRIDRMNLGYGVESVSLRASRIGKLFSRQSRLDHVGPEREDGENETGWGELLDRLTERLGPRAARAMTVVETYVPEEAFPLRAWPGTRERSPRPDDDGATNGVDRANRPSHLFKAPEPAQVMSLVPDGPPSWMRWRGREYRVRCGGGPERLALPWWEAKRGASPNAVRDYYEVEDDQGRFLWVFRDHAANEWFVHGLWV